MLKLTLMLGKHPENVLGTKNMEILWFTHPSQLQINNVNSNVITFLAPSDITQKLGKNNFVIALFSNFLKGFNIMLNVVIMLFACTCTVPALHVLKISWKHYCS